MQEEASTVTFAELATTFSQVLRIDSAIREKEKCVEALKHYQAGNVEMGIQILEQARILDRRVNKLCEVRSACFIIHKAE